LSDEQVEDLHRLYQNEWWTKGRTLPDVRRMLEHSTLIFGFCDPDTRRLVAFARVLTDFTYKAFLFDVIVAPHCRNEGLGRTLMDAVLRHPALQSVRHIELYCLPELVPFYERWGFTDDLGAVRLMRKTA
jgi:predicted GNAT family N-acyltransferase